MVVYSELHNIDILIIINKNAGLELEL